jgi:phosphotransferase system HPr-like phosphotransfer protein
LLEAVTQLTHFVERHDRGFRTDQADERIQSLVSRTLVRQVTLEKLLVWARVYMAAGRELAESLVSSYTRHRTVEVELPEAIYLHARPCALIVRVVTHHGTPVEMLIEEHRSNAASILELMVAVGSNPGARRVTFRGDERPLADLVRLFGAGVGERGLDTLPVELGYLRRGL